MRDDKTNVVGYGFTTQAKAFKKAKDFDNTTYKPPQARLLG